MKKKNDNFCKNYFDWDVRCKKSTKIKNPTRFKDNFHETSYNHVNCIF